jgi:hypothetical protein
MHIVDVFWHVDARGRILRLPPDREPTVAVAVNILTYNDAG